MAPPPLSTRIATALVVSAIIAVPLLLIVTGVAGLAVVFFKPDLIQKREIVTEDPQHVAQRFLDAFRAYDEETMRALLVFGERGVQQTAARNGQHLLELMPTCEAARTRTTIVGHRELGGGVEVDVDVSFHPCDDAEAERRTLRLVLPLERHVEDDSEGFKRIERRTWRVNLGWRAYLAAIQARFDEAERPYMEFLSVSDSKVSAGPNGTSMLSYQLANYGSRTVTEVLVEVSCTGGAAKMFGRPVDPHMKHIVGVHGGVLTEPLPPNHNRVTTLLLMPDIAQCEQVTTRLAEVRLAPVEGRGLPVAKAESCGRVAEQKLGTLLLPSLQLLEIGPGCFLGAAPDVDVRIPKTKPRQLGFVRTPAGAIAKNLGKPQDVQFDGKGAMSHALDVAFYIDLADATLLFRPPAAE